VYSAILPEALPTNVPVIGPEKAVAVNVPPALQDGAPVESLAGVIPPSLTIMAPPESWVVELSTAPDAKGAASTNELRSDAETCPVEKVVPLDMTAILGSGG
jgi:hypothetical protein